MHMYIHVNDVHVDVDVDVDVDVHVDVVVIHLHVHVYTCGFLSPAILSPSPSLSLPFFQIRCFDAPLQPNALKDVKNIVKRNTNSGIENNGVTLEGQYYT